MKKFHSLLLAVLFVYSALAETFNIGGTKIEIPIPQGFVRANKETEQFFAEQIKTATPHTEVFAVYIQDWALEDILKGFTVKLEKYYILLAYPMLFRDKVSVQAFSEFKLGMKEPMQENRIKIHKRLEQREIRPNNIHAVLRAEPALPLDFHSETDSTLAFSLYSKEETGVGSLFNIWISTMTAFNVSGRVLSLGCYAQEDKGNELEWTRETSKKMVEAIIKANPSAPDRGSASGERAYQRGRKVGFFMGGIYAVVLVVGVPLLVIVLVIFLLVKLFKRKPKPNTSSANHQKPLPTNIRFKQQPKPNTPAPPPTGIEAACPCCGESINIPADFKGAANCPICKQNFNVE